MTHGRSSARSKGRLRSVRRSPHRSPSPNWLFSIAALSGALCGCAPTAEVSEATEWQLVDLLEEEPVVKFVADPAHRKRAAFSSGVSYLGPGTMPDLSVPLDKRPQMLRSARVRSVAQREGTELRYRLRLGDAAYFSFTPLRNQEHPRPFRFRVWVLDGRQRTEVASLRNGESERVAASTHTVDLSRWSRRRVTLVLNVEPLDGKETVDVAHEGGLWASPLVVSRRPHAEASAPSRPNVVLLTVDTLRADSLGAWGATPSVTPALDSLAEESELWSRALSSFNVTNPSVASLMTGLYGRKHGVYDLQGRLAESHTTLAEVFAANGYDTLAVVSVRHLGKVEGGLRQGFATVVDTNRQLSAEVAVNEAMRGIVELEAPFFVWIHLFDPHTPHTPPEPFASGVASEQARGLSPSGSWREFRAPGPLDFEVPVLGAHRQLYRGEVAYVDRQVDRLVGFLREGGLLDRSIVAFTADHGENFDEHGIRFRHAGLFETTTHIPLMIRWPGAERAGLRHDDLVQNVDLFPTLLAAAKLEVPKSDGVSLRSEPETGTRKLAWSEASGRNGVRVRSVTHAYMESKDNPFVADGAYLFDLVADPGEEVNLAGRGLPEEERLRAALERWQAEAPASDSTRTPLSSEEIEQLRSLGYL